MNAETDSERFAALLDAVGEVYDREVSPLRHPLYFSALKDYDFEIVEAAIAQHIKRSKFFPTPADITEVIEGSESDREGVAWSALTSAIAVVGPYQSIIVEDPAVASAIGMTFGSWVGACQSRRELSEGSWHARRRDFAANLRVARRQLAGAPKGPRVLTGISDAENRASRASWREGTKLTSALYGVLAIDGKVRSERVAIDEQTLLPKAAIADLLLPPASPRALLPAHDETPIDPEFIELTPDQARERFSEKFRALLAQKGLTKNGRTSASVQAEGGREDSEPLPDAEAGGREGDGAADRGADPNREAAAVGARVPVRENDRSKVGLRSRMAGADARAGDRGRRVRAGRARGAGRVDEVAREDRSPQAKRDRPRRRKA